MDRFFEGVIWGTLIAVISIFSWQGWLILGATAIIPLFARWQRSTSTLHTHARSPAWIGWVGLSAPFILASVRAFLLPLLDRSYFSGRPLTLPILLLIWGTALLVLWRYRHDELQIWIPIAITCLWSYGVYMTSICTFTVVCPFL